MNALLLQAATVPITSSATPTAPATAIGQPNTVAMAFFFLFIAVTLGIKIGRAHV